MLVIDAKKSMAKNKKPMRALHALEDRAGQTPRTTRNSDDVNLELNYDLRSLLLIFRRIFKGLDTWPANVKHIS